jgi:hypothetical protein
VSSEGNEIYIYVIIQNISFSSHSIHLYINKAKKCKIDIYEIKKSIWSVVLQLFKDIFVIQILGILIARQYSGVVRFVFNDNEAKVWFHKGIIIGMHCFNTLDTNVLKVIAWYHQGKITFEKQDFSGSFLDYPQLVEDLISHSSVVMPDICPMISQAFITRARLKPLKNSTFNQTSLPVLIEVGSGKLLEELKSHLSKKALWDNIVYLAANGLIITSYAQSLGIIVKNFQDALVDKIKKMLGAHVAKMYTDKLSENMAPLLENIDPIYGSEPYRLWVKMIADSSQQVGMKNLQERCLESTLTNLSPNDGRIIHHFLYSRN